MERVWQKVLAITAVTGLSMNAKALIIDNFSEPGGGVYSQTTDHSGTLNVQTNLGGGAQRTVTFLGTLSGNDHGQENQGHQSNKQQGDQGNRSASIGIDVGSNTQGAPEGYKDQNMLVMQSKGYKDIGSQALWGLSYTWGQNGLDLASNSAFVVNFASAGSANQINDNGKESIMPSLSSTLTLTDAHGHTISTTEDVNHVINGSLALTYTGFTGASAFNWSGIQGASFRFNSLHGDGSNPTLYSVQSVQTTPTPEPATWFTLGVGVVGVSFYLLRRRAMRASSRRS